MCVTVGRASPSRRALNPPKIFTSRSDVCWHEYIRARYCNHGENCAHRIDQPPPRLRLDAKRPGSEMHHPHDTAEKVCVMRVNYIRGECVTFLLSDNVTVCPRMCRLPQYDFWILPCKRQTDLLQPVYEGTVSRTVYPCFKYACVPPYV